MGRWTDWLVPTGGAAVLLTAVGWLVSFGPVADDVSGRASAQLKSEGHGWASVAIDGRDVTLTGVAPSEAALQLAIDSADRVFGVRVVEAKATVVPIADPYIFSASREGDRVTLSGSVPSQESRAALLAWAKKVMPTATIEDKLAIARGAPVNFPAAAAFAVGQLADLKQGAAGLVGAGYSIAGDPKDHATYLRLKEALKSALPADVKIVADELVVPIPSPYRFGLTTAGGKATIDGYLPDAATRAKVLEALRARFTAGVEDKVEVIPGAPAGFVDAILKLLPGLSRLTDGGFDLSGTTVSVKGGVLTEAIGRQVLDRLKGLLPAGFMLGAGAPKVLPPPPQVDAATCQSLLAKVQTGEKILFETGKARLDERSIAVLDALVGGSLACLEARITVEGHTDADGDEAANQALSEARAAAVVGYLTSAGIDARRLSAVGHGATRPVASNDTAEGKQKNRRIDFLVE
ncbi:MAG: OmpA family protein [Siculibacillus sp.]|nr:OmpA family protein [Siculibacillus sp.]